MTIKPKRQQSETPYIPQGRDAFQTPNYAVDILIPFLPSKIKCVWECAAGHGKIVRRLRHHGYKVNSTDIQHDPIWIDRIHNFLDGGMVDSFDAIITNPPFSIKEKFYKRCALYNLPFALLIPADYSGWIIQAVDKDGCEKIIPTRRVDYITPTGRNGKNSSSPFHSMWLTWGFGLGKSETFVELTNEQKKINI